MTTKFDFLRHGEPVGGVMFRGSGTDHPLSDLGWQQMHAAIASKSGWDAIVTSPMLRAYAFAKQVAEQHHLPLEIVHDLREAGYGMWEGLTPEVVRANDLAAYRALYADPVNQRPLGAEPLAEFTERVLQAFDYLGQQYENQHILVVSHSGTMRAILCHVLGAPIASQQLISPPYAYFYNITWTEVKGLQINL